MQQCALGGFILFFGFLAFNGGSQGSISNAGDAAAVSLAIVNTILGGRSDLLLIITDEVFIILCPNLPSFFCLAKLIHIWYSAITVSGAGAAITAMVIKRMGYASKNWSLLVTINGGLTGMVSNHGSWR